MDEDTAYLVEIGNEPIPTYVDLVICIDVSDNMKEALNSIQQCIIDFPQVLTDCLKNRLRDLKSLRIKIIPFTNYKENKSNVIKESKFFCLPEESSQFESYIERIEVCNNKSQKVDGLDVLAMAMNSDWIETNFGKKTYQMILLFSNSATNPIGSNPDPSYPQNDLELHEWWSSWEGAKVDQRSKRMIVLTPRDESWDVFDYMDATILIQSPLSKKELDDIMDLMTGPI